MRVVEKVHVNASGEARKGEDKGKKNGVKDDTMSHGLIL